MFFSFISYSCEEEFLIIKAKVNTQAISEITHNSALSGGILIFDGGDGISEKGVVYSSRPRPTVNDQHIVSGQGMGDFNTVIHGLRSGTQYFVRAYASNSVGLSYGCELDFTTLPSVPELELFEIMEVSVHSAEAKGGIIHDGGASVSEKGFCWSTSLEPTVDDHAIFDEGWTGNKISLLIPGLNPNTHYFLRAFAKNRFGISYSKTGEFKTKDRLPDAPKLPGNN